MRQLLGLIALLALAACAADGGGSDWQPLDLTPYDVPLTILAPDSARVATSDLSGLMQDVTVRSDADDYSIQILARRTATNDLASLKADQLQYVRDGRYFSRIVEEDPAGFIFENRIDSTSIYGFRHIVFQGDREFVFQNAFDGTFGLPAIRAMYGAVRSPQ